MQCVLGGALVGAVAFVLLYGFAPLDVTGDAWLRGGYIERDSVQHYTGWLFYRASPWAFPLGIAQNFNYPTGGYIGLSDSIPLFGVFFKLLSPILPATFQYFGLWCFMCSVLQGAAAALLLNLFSQSRLRCLLLCSLFVFSPILLDRQLRHCALGAQWLILFALYLYFKHRRSGCFFSPGFAVLCALSIVIHPYFTPMVFALLFALLLENAVFCKKIWQPLASLGLCFAATLLLGWVFGVFHMGAGGGGTTYGFFSMNLNAVFNPTSAGDTRWSLFLPVQNQTLGNYDGFNYLGLGVLATGVVVLADGLIHIKKTLRPALGWLRSHFGMLFVCLCLSVFAVSNTVTAQGRVWFTIPLPQAILELAGNLRSSGRMFYPVWYLTLLFACVYWLRLGSASLVRMRSSEKLRTAAVVGLVAVQLLDLSPGLYARARSFRPYEPVYHNTLESDFWQQIAGAYSHLASLDGAALTHTIDVAEYTADNNMTTTDPFTARFDVDQHSAQVSEAKAALEAKTPRADTLYVTSVEKTFLKYGELLQGAPVFCAQVDERWYVFAPYNQQFSGYTGGDGAVLSFADYPLLIADYYDDLWEGGVLRSDRRMVCFNDTDYARQHIDGMAAFRAGGVTYPILEVSYEDEGWILVTLDTADATPLQGVPLESVPAGDNAGGNTGETGGSP